MQQFLTSIFGENKVAQYGAMAVVAIIALLLLWWAFRTVFSGRVRPAGGRNRQPRIGIVDAYDLDRQRQLVIIRRDGIEHLVMIGGPNDVVIESGIVRVQTPSRERSDREQTVHSLGHSPEQKLTLPLQPDDAIPLIKAEDSAKVIITPPQVPIAPPAPVPVTPAIAASLAPVAAAAASLVEAAPAEPVLAAEAPAVIELPPPPEVVVTPPKSIFSKMASRISAVTAPAKTMDVPRAEEPAPVPVHATPVHVEPVHVEPVAAAPLRPPVPLHPAAEASAEIPEIPTFTPHKPVEVPPVAHHHAPAHEPAAIRPEIFPPLPPEPAVEHSKEDLDLLKQLQSWVPPQVPAIEAAKEAAAPAPVAPTVRQPLSTLVPRPTFTPRTFTPMKPINPPKLEKPAAAPATASDIEKALEEAVKPQSAQAPALDDLEEEMARLLGRPVKHD